MATRKDNDAYKRELRKLSKHTKPDEAFWKQNARVAKAESKAGLLTRMFSGLWA